MISEEVQTYSSALTDIGIDHAVVEHPDLRTPPEVQGYLGLTLADGLSTMIMKAGEKFVVVIRRCDCRLDSKKLKKLVGNKLRIANPEEFSEISGMPLGAARAFSPGFTTYLDEKLFEKEYLTGGSGSFVCSIRYRSEDLKNLPASVVVKISQ
jgi:prolyl-tRNA editing enzyme YbaK/EbsC (Cys-tRNA(Pro) deacylase)